MDDTKGVYTFSFMPATAGASSWTANDIIGISAYKSGTNEIYSGYINKQYKANGNSSFNPVTADDKIFWSPNNLLDFIAYHPYKEGTFSEYKIDLSSQSSQKSIDLLYSNNAKGKNKASGDAELIFDHALSKVVIYSTPGKNLTQDDLKGMTIALNSVYDEAIFNLFDGNIETLGEKTSIVLNTEPDGYRSEAIILPGSAADVSLTIMLPDIGIYKAYLPENQFFLSKTAHYYSVKVNRANIEISQVDIADWLVVGDYADTISTAEPIYNIGDFYPNHSDPVTALGIVYWLKPGTNGEEGKIVSFNTVNILWSVLNNKTVYAESIVNGALNMATIKTINPTLEYFPAFLWCDMKGEGWYLPARYELHILQEQWVRNKDLINDNILLADGVPFSENDIYLTSSESRNSPLDKAESYGFANKEWSSNDKLSIQKVRAIKVF